MKKSIFRVAAVVFLAAILNLFISCDDKVMGYSVLLWDMPEYKIQSGQVLPVYIRSNISHVYVAGVAGNSDALEKIEIPLWQLTEPVKKNKLNTVTKKYEECAHTYASVKTDGLACRAEPVNASFVVVPKATTMVSSSSWESSSRII